MTNTQAVLRAHLISRLNDEIRITNDEPRNSISILARLFVIRLARRSQPTTGISSLIRHSSFVLRQLGMTGHGLMVPSCSRPQEKAVKAAKVRPERLAIYRRNKFGLCIPGIFAFRYLQWNLWHFDLFVLVGPLPPPQKAMTPTKRLLLSGGGN